MNHIQALFTLQGFGHLSSCRRYVFGGGSTSLDPNEIRAFQSILLQTSGDYKKAAEESKSLRGISTINKVTVLSTILFIVFVGSTLYRFSRKREYKYVYALAKLYVEIDNKNAFNSISNEAEVDTTGIDLASIE